MSTQLAYSNSTSGALDCTPLSTISGFTISGTVPTGCDVRTLFSVDAGATWNKLTIASGAATFTATTTQAITADSVIAEGNTIAELQTVTSCAEMAGKTVYVAVAMQSSGDSVPTFGIKANGLIGTDVTTKTVESPEYTLASSNVEIIKATVDSATADGGSVTVQASLYTTTTTTGDDGTATTTGTWSDYQAITAIKTQKAAKIKFKATYTATVIGTSTATLASVTVLHKSSDASVSGLTANIISDTKNLNMDVRYIRATLVHEKLKDADIEAYVAFRDATKTRERILIGTGTGEKQTLTLGVAGTSGTVTADTGIDLNKLVIYLGNTATSDYETNLKTNQVTITADAGTNIYASYTYGWNTETWQKMTQGNRDVYQNDTSHYATAWSFALDDDAAAKQIAAINYKMIRTEGSIKDVALGTANGTTQVYVLNHICKAETLVIPGASSFVVSNDNILSVVAPKGTELKASYDYTGSTPKASFYVMAWNR